MTELHMTKDETATFVIEGQKVTLTAQQLLGLKQAETTDPDEKYHALLKQLEPQWAATILGVIVKKPFVEETPFGFLPSENSVKRVIAYRKLLNIAAKLNGEEDWNGLGEFLYAYEGEIYVGTCAENHKDAKVKFKSGLALEALTYLNSEDKIAMFGCDKVKQD